MSDIIKILTAVVVIAILAVIVSKNAKAQELITAVGNALSQIVAKATGPVK